MSSYDSKQIFKKEEDIVTFLYEVILKRDPDESGLSTYAEKLRNGEMTVPDLVRILYLSDENKSKREMFRQASNLSLYDFLQTIKDTPVYNQLNSLAAMGLRIKDGYDDTLFVYKFKPNSLVVTNKFVNQKDITVYTTNDSIRTLLKGNGIPVVDIFTTEDKKFESCYFINPSMFDAVGIIIRRLDEICNVIYANEMADYLGIRSNKLASFPP